MVVSRIVSRTGNVLGMSAVHGMRRVGRVCEHCCDIFTTCRLSRWSPLTSLSRSPPPHTIQEGGG